jgi:hypothetical protein
MLSTDSAWNDPANDEANVAYTRAFCDAAARSRLARPTSLPGLFEEGDAATRASYGAGYDRPGADQGRLRPRQPLPAGQNIRPAAQGAPLELLG